MNWKSIFKKTSQYLELKLAPEELEKIISFFLDEKSKDLEIDPAHWSYFPSFLRQQISHSIGSFAQEIAFLEYYLWYFDHSSELGLQALSKTASANSMSKPLKLNPDMTFLPVFFDLEKIMNVSVYDWTDDFLKQHREKKVLLVAQPTTTITNNFYLGDANTAQVIDLLSEESLEEKDLLTALSADNKNQELVKFLIQRNFIGNF